MRHSVFLASFIKKVVKTKPKFVTTVATSTGWRTNDPPFSFVLKPLF